MTLSYVYATSNDSNVGNTSNSNQTLSNDDETTISDESSQQEITTSEEDNNNDPFTDSDLQTLSGNLFEEKPVDETLFKPQVEGVKEFLLTQIFIRPMVI